MDDSWAEIDGVSISGAGCGGIQVLNESEVVLTNSHIEGCYAEYGGGLYASVDSTVDVSDTVFIGNDAAFGGAARVENGTFSRCLFLGNHAGMTGGAIQADGEAIITDSVFASNDAGGAAGIGGTVIFRNNIVSFGNVNSCDGSEISGSLFAGAVYASGTTSIEDSAIAGSGPLSNYHCGDTGGYSYSCEGEFSGTSYLRNVTLVESVGAGVEVDTGCTVYVRGAIVWGNSGISGADSVEYSLVQGGYSGEGNISSNPQFTGYPAWSGTWTDAYFDEGLFQTELTDEDASWEPGELAGLFVKLGELSSVVRMAVIADNTENTIWAWGWSPESVDPGDSYQILDLHLQPDSPAVDAGFGAGVFFSTDVEGNPRYDDPDSPNVFDCDFEPGCLEYVDMGAYEYQP